MRRDQRCSDFPASYLMRPIVGRLLSHSRDPIVRNFWLREFAEYSSRFASEAIAPVQNKVGTLLATPALRNVLGQTRSTLHMREIIDQGRVLIVNLAKGTAWRNAQPSARSLYHDGLRASRRTARRYT